MALKITLDNLSEICQKIVTHFQPIKIVLFGSQAYGVPHDGSDFDLLIIMEFSGRGFRKALEIDNQLGNPYPLDLIVKTPQEVIHRYEQFDPLVREALDKGKILYERDSQRVAS